MAKSHDLRQEDHSFLHSCQNNIFEIIIIISRPVVQTLLPMLKPVACTDTRMHACTQSTHTGTKNNTVIALPTRLTHVKSQSFRLSSS